MDIEVSSKLPTVESIEKEDGGTKIGGNVGTNVGVGGNGRVETGTAVGMGASGRLAALHAATPQENRQTATRRSTFTGGNPPDPPPGAPLQRPGRADAS